MEDPEVTKKKVADFLQTLTSPGRLNLKFNILACNGQVQPNASDPAGAVAPATQSTPEISVELSGPDVPLVLARNGELLLAIEHIAAKILRFEHEEHDRISFDAENFKVLRHQELVLAAEAAIDRVRRTGQPFSFSPMSSRERRLLHMALATFRPGDCILRRWAAPLRRSLSGRRKATCGAKPGRSRRCYPPALPSPLVILIRQRAAAGESHQPLR